MGAISPQVMKISYLGKAMLVTMKVTICRECNTKLTDTWLEEDVKHDFKDGFKDCEELVGISQECCDKCNEILEKECRKIIDH